MEVCKIVPLAEYARKYLDVGWLGEIITCRFMGVVLTNNSSFQNICPLEKFSR